MAQIHKSLPSGTPIELWSQVEARTGQQTKLIRRCAKQGTRPQRPKISIGLQTESSVPYVPLTAKGPSIVKPRCNNETMSAYLEEIAFHAAPGTHAVLMLDQAGWHASTELDVPAYIPS